MIGGFKTRRIPRDLMLDPPPRRSRWWLWTALTLVLVISGFFTASILAVPLK